MTRLMRSAALVAALLAVGACLPDAARAECATAAGLDFCAMLNGKSVNVDFAGGTLAAVDFTAKTQAIYWTGGNCTTSSCTTAQAMGKASEQCQAAVKTLTCLTTAAEPKSTIATECTSTPPTVTECEAAFDACGKKAIVLGTNNADAGEKAVFCSALETVQVCGHDSTTCPPLSSPELAITISVWVLGPVAIVFFGALYLCMQENELGCFARPRGPPPAAAAAPSRRAPAAAAPRAADRSVIELSSVGAPAASAVRKRTSIPADSDDDEPEDKPDAPAGAGRGGSTGPWQCPDCTFTNPASAGTCEMCTRARP